MEDWGALAASLGGGAETADVLEQLYESGRTSWSSLPLLPPAELVAQIAVHLPPGADLPGYLRSLVAPDLYLACACLLRVPQALAAFDAELLTRVPSYLTSIDTAPHFVDEVMAILRARLLVGRNDARPRIADYTGRGALAS
jgi:RNA polymerase sigma-70 factor (ECF subfamily)